MKRLLPAAILVLGCAAALRADVKGGDADLTLDWINFAILVAVGGYFLAKSLPPFFRSRSSGIQKGILEAQQIKREAEARASQVEAKLAALGAEIEKLRSEAHAEMEKEGARIRQETERHIQKLGEQAEREIETAGKLARRQLQAYAAKLSLDLAEERVREKLTPPVENGLIEDFVSDLEASRN
ncbi:MAG TPA: ATP synthase F0 subunit B [Bryobacteraceae bacterium]|jgi:F-type H+-transporting ATPase subunit b|nr:ATP synthase F0 subunit B [Bryobacteraceae bacterium]